MVSVDVKAHVSFFLSAFLLLSLLLIGSTSLILFSLEDRVHCPPGNLLLLVLGSLVFSWEIRLQWCLIATHSTST